MAAYQLFPNVVNTKGGDYISILKDYQVNFPAVFYERNEIRNKKSVLLFFDSQADKIAFVFKDKKVPQGFVLALAHNGKRSNGHIGPKSFFKHNGLMGNIRTGRYDYGITGIDGEKAFEIQLERTK